MRPLLLLLALGLSASAAQAATSYAAIPASADELTLFGFDNYSLPFLRNLAVTMHPPEKYAGNPVLAEGGPGAPDEYSSQLYGSVIRIGGKLRMWYLGGIPAAVETLSQDIVNFKGWSVCYAESDDGLRWTKPNLGLVELNGNRNNNIVQFSNYEGKVGNQPGPGNVFVLYEPGDPDPSRRYKMLMLVAPSVPENINNILPFFSADGLHWRQAVPGRVDQVGNISTDGVRLPLDHFEMGGFYHFQGTYYVTGQQIAPYTWLPEGTTVGRSMSIFRSYDFLHWSESRSQAFVRWGYHTAAVSHGEEAHMPAASWNRGNVIVGIYGQFHGRPGSKLHPLDLGFLISNDGSHFREPINDYVLIPHDPKHAWESGGVVQGQAYIDMGEQTYIYYCGWNGDVSDPKTKSSIGLTRMRRDGFGSLSPKRPGITGSVTSCVLTSDGTARLWVNADGLSPRAALKIEVVDEQERPVDGFAPARVEQPGLRVPVCFGRVNELPPSARYRIRATFEGPDSRQIKLFAMYVGRQR